MKKYVIIGVVLSVIGGLWLLMGPVTIRTTEVEYISVTGENIHEPRFAIARRFLRPGLVIEGIIFTHYDYRMPSYDFAAIFAFEQDTSLTNVELLEAVFISDDGAYILDITNLMDKDSSPRELYIYPGEFPYDPYSETLGQQEVPPDQWFVFSWNNLPITLGTNTLILKGTYCEASGCTEFSSEIKFRLYEQTRYSTRIFEIASGV